MPGAIVAELTEDTAEACPAWASPPLSLWCGSAVTAPPFPELLALNEGVLETVYPTPYHRRVRRRSPCSPPPPLARTAPKAEAWPVPKVLIPVFPGTNCEYDTARAVAAGRSGALRSWCCATCPLRTWPTVRRAASPRQPEDSQIVVVPGGFSGGDEPDGSAKFITAFFRNPAVRDAIMDLLKSRDGLMLGICNGFQALIKLGLVPYGEIIEHRRDLPHPDLSTPSAATSPSLVRTRVASNQLPVAGRRRRWAIFTPSPSPTARAGSCAVEELVRKLADNGQIATQYVDRARCTPAWTWT